MPSLLENTVKYGLLAVTSPIWWPIAKTLWAELQAALWREGGLIGREPTQREIPLLRERYKEFSSPLINESLAEFKARESREVQDRLDEEKNPTRKGGKPSAGGQRARASQAVVRSHGTQKKVGGGSGARRARTGVVRPAPPQAKRTSQGFANPKSRSTGQESSGGARAPGFPSAKSSGAGGAKPAGFASHKSPGSAGNPAPGSANQGLKPQGSAGKKSPGSTGPTRKRSGF